MIKADVDGSELFALFEVVGLAGIEGDAVSGVLEVEAELSVRSSLTGPEPLGAFFFFVIIESVRRYCSPILGIIAAYGYSGAPQRTMFRVAPLAEEATYLTGGFATTYLLQRDQ